MMRKKITLIGYMGCGKSTIQRALAKETELPAMDLDAYIELREKQKISEIFKEKGSVYFRKKETHYLKELLENDHYPIVALGGGTPCFGENMALINEKSSSFYLKASSELLFKRLLKGQKKRPLIADIPKDELENFIKKHLFEREVYYNQADFVINIDGKSKKMLVDAIIKNEPNFKN